MIKTRIIFILILILIFIGCATKSKKINTLETEVKPLTEPPVIKKIFSFDQPIPPQVLITEASQEFFDHPPLYIPAGKRETITVYSPHFTLAIPNAMDMTGKSSDLQKSVSDILYTEIFNQQGDRRIDLVDRGALVNVDTQIIVDSLYNNRLEPNPKIDSSFRDPVLQSNSSQQISPKQSINTNLLDLIRKDTTGMAEYLKNADGLLLLYLTSRVGSQNGYFVVDYRIVINKGFQEKIVLLAGSQKIHYDLNDGVGIEFNRNDLKEIVSNIYNRMTIKNSKNDKNVGVEIRIVKFDPPFIVINIGKAQNLMPGMIGYVVERDNSVRTGSFSNPHYSYIAEFLVTDVFETTSNAILISQNNEKDHRWDVQVQDVVVIK